MMIQRHHCTLQFGERKTAIPIFGFVRDAFIGVAIERLANEFFLKL